MTEPEVKSLLQERLAPFLCICERMLIVARLPYLLCLFWLRWKDGLNKTCHTLMATDRIATYLSWDARSSPWLM